MQLRGELLDFLQRRSFVAFLCVALLHAFAWVLVPILTQPNAPLDTLEMIYWGREWQLGYYKHPPMPGWLAAIACWGQNDAWPTYLLAQIATLTCFWCAFEVGRSMLGNAKALLAVMLMQGCYYYNFTTVEFNNNVTSRAFWAIAIVCLYKAILGSANSNRVSLGWVFAGMSIGAGMLSKYDTAILAVTMLGFSMFHSQGRKCWKSWGPFACLAAAMIVFAPHLYWLIKNDFPTIAYFLKRSDSPHTLSTHVISPFKFGMAQLSAVAPIALLAVPLLGWKWRWKQDFNDRERLDRDFLLWFALGPFLLVLVIGLLLGVHIRSMWGTAMWTYFAVSLLFFVKFDLQPRAVNRTAMAVAGFAVLALVVFAARNTLLPELRGKASRVHYPGRQLAEAAEAYYQQQFGALPEVVAGPWWEAANVAFYGTGSASVYADADAEISPWMNDSLFKEKGGVIVWEVSAGTKEFEKSIAERFPDRRMAAPLELRWQTGADLTPIQFAIAVVPPRNARALEQQSDLDPLAEKQDSNPQQPQGLSR